MAKASSNFSGKKPGSLGRMLLDPYSDCTLDEAWSVASVRVLPAYNWHQVRVFLCRKPMMTNNTWLLLLIDGVVVSTTWLITSMEADLLTRKDVKVLKQWCDINYSEWFESEMNKNLIDIISAIELWSLLNLNFSRIPVPITSCLPSAWAILQRAMIFETSIYI